MKHVFIIHSNITYLISCQVIKDKKIDDKDVVFLLHRNYKLPQTCIFKKLLLHNEFVFTKNFILNYLNLKLWKSKLNKSINGYFHAYLPHTFIPKFAMIVDSNKCLRYSYIEEGLAAYNEKNMVRINYSCWQNFKNNLRYASQRLVNLLKNHKHFTFNDDKYSASFVVNDQALLGAPNRVKISLNFDNNDIRQDFDCVIVFDAISIFGIINKVKTFELLTDKIIPHIKNSKYKRVAFKLHPEHYYSEVGVMEAVVLREILKSHLEDVLELDRNFILEQYLYSSRAVVYTYVSSLGFYAAIWGNSAYGLYNEISKLNNAFNIPNHIVKKFIQL